MARASLLVAFSLLALAAGDADQSCSNGVEEAALLQMVNSNGKAKQQQRPMPSPPSGSGSGSGCDAPLSGMDNSGSNMDSSPGAGYSGDASSCQQLCENAPTCLGWTFMQATNSATKQCWLKDANLNCPATDADQTWNTYTSGFCHGGCSSPSPTPTPSPPSGSGCDAPLSGMDNSGSNMGSSPGAGYSGDASSCQQLCENAPTCLGWTFMQATNSATKQCWLKDANLNCPATNADQTWNTYTSGFCHGGCPPASATPYTSR